MSPGLISAIKVGRAKRRRACFCILASDSTTVLIYILITANSVLFYITFRIQRAVHHFLLQQTTTYFYCCCIDTGVEGANIGDQSRACETRPYLFLYPCNGVDICTDIPTGYSTHCVGFASLLKIGELYIISKSHGRVVLKTDYHRLCAIVDCCVDTPAICDERYVNSVFKYFTATLEGYVVMKPNTLRHGKHLPETFRIHTLSFVLRLPNAMSH